MAYLPCLVQPDGMEALPIPRKILFAALSPNARPTVWPEPEARALGRGREPAAPGTSSAGGRSRPWLAGLLEVRS